MIKWIFNTASSISVIHCDCFGVEHVRKEIKAFINNKNIKKNIFRIQAYNSIMSGYFCIGFIGFMLKGKSLTKYTNFFSLNNLKKNNDIILNYFMSGI